MRWVTSFELGRARDVWHLPASVTRNACHTSSYTSTHSIRAPTLGVQHFSKSQAMLSCERVSRPSRSTAVPRAVPRRRMPAKVQPWQAGYYFGKLLPSGSAGPRKEGRETPSSVCGVCGVEVKSHPPRCMHVARVRNEQNERTDYNNTCTQSIELNLSRPSSIWH